MNNYFESYETAYIGRTAAFYDEESEYIFTPDMWTYSTDPNDKEFAGEVYELSEEGKDELNWYIRSRQLNEYQRKHAFNPNNNSPEEQYNELVNNYVAKQIKA